MPLPTWTRHPLTWYSSFVQGHTARHELDSTCFALRTSGPSYGRDDQEPKSSWWLRSLALALRLHLHATWGTARSDAGLRDGHSCRPQAAALAGDIFLPWNSGSRCRACWSSSCQSLTRSRSRSQSRCRSHGGNTGWFTGESGGKHGY